MTIFRHLGGISNDNLSLSFYSCELCGAAVVEQWRFDGHTYREGDTARNCHTHWHDLMEGDWR